MLFALTDTDDIARSYENLAVALAGPGAVSTRDKRLNRIGAF